MKIIVQRVSQASCTVNNDIISEIKDGYVLLVGLTHTDTSIEVEYLAKKVANLRIFEDDEGKLNKSILDKNYEILSISQFTLYGETKKGNRPSFTNALEPSKAIVLYHELTNILNNTYNINTLEGEFGAMMDINLTNSGPVTILLESK